MQNKERIKEINSSIEELSNQFKKYTKEEEINLENIKNSIISNILVGMILIIISIFLSVMVVSLGNILIIPLIILPALFFCCGVSIICDNEDLKNLLKETKRDFNFDYLDYQKEMDSLNDELEIRKLLEIKTSFTNAKEIEKINDIFCKNRNILNKFSSFELNYLSGCIKNKFISEKLKESLEEKDLDELQKEIKNNIDTIEDLDELQFIKENLFKHQKVKKKYNFKGQ